MSWSISTRETKNGTKYKFWTSITGGCLTNKWLTKDEAIKFLFWIEFGNFASKFLRNAMTFPNDWRNKSDNGLYLKHPEEFNSLMAKCIDDDKLFYETFSKELEKLNIKLIVEDGEVGFKTKK